MRKNIASHRGDKGPFMKGSNSSNRNVSNTLVRGRAALEEAENHIKIFDDYLKKNASHNALRPFESNGMGKKVQTNGNNIFELNELLPFRDATPSEDFESPNIQNSMATKANRAEYTAEIKLINEMMEQYEHRKKRDELIQQDANFSDEFICSSRTTFQPLNIIRVKNRKSKRKGMFHPKELSVAKRAVVKESKIAENHAHFEAQLKKQSEFKARPLPSGNLVKNDPYALTKAAKGKMSQSRGIPVQRDIKKNRLDASSILGQCHDTNMSFPNNPHALNTRKNRLDASCILDVNHINDDGINSPTTPIASCRKGLANDLMYGEITDFVEKEQEIDCEHDNDANEITEKEENEKDLKCLHQQIAKLQAELNLKRMQCFQAIEEIELQGTGDKNLSTGCDDKNSSTGYIIESDEVYSSKNDIKSPIRTTKNKKAIFPSKLVKSNTSLYDRHYIWLKMREEKRKNAKEREDIELVKVVTGRPNLHGAKESWEKAKQQHDGLLESLRLKDENIKFEKQEKDRMMRQKQHEEIERLKVVTSQKNKASKSGIDGKKQSEYADKLARPTSSRRKKVDVNVKKCNNVNVEEVSCINHENIEEKSEGSKARSSDNEKEEVSYADMDDREFSKMIKKLKAKAGKGNRIVLSTTKVNLEHEKRDLIDEDESSSNNLESSIAEDLIDKKLQQSQFISGSAQAKLFAEINNEIQSKLETDSIEYDVPKKKDNANGAKKPNLSFPYQRYECGEITFFDRSSSIDRGRFRVRDAREYHTDSLRRIPVPYNTSSSCEGVMFLVGKKKANQDCDHEDVVTVLFDRSQYEEEEAEDWWKKNRNQIIVEN